MKKKEEKFLKNLKVINNKNHSALTNNFDLLIKQLLIIFKNRLNSAYNLNIENDEKITDAFIEKMMYGLLKLNRVSFAKHNTRFQEAIISIETFIKLENEIMMKNINRSTIGN